jgi:hypothetical protein
VCRKSNRQIGTDCTELLNDKQKRFFTASVSLFTVNAFEAKPPATLEKHLSQWTRLFEANSFLSFILVIRVSMRCLKFVFKKRHADFTTIILDRRATP